MSTESKKNRDSELTQCIACRRELPVQSSLCSRCGSYQQAWKNQLRYFSTIVGLATLFLTALVYLASAIPQLWKMLSWRDRVQVLDVSFPGEIILANIGDGDVVAREFYWSGEVEKMNFNGWIQINKKVSTHEVVETKTLLRVDSHKVQRARFMRSDEVPKESRYKIFKEAQSDTNDCYDFRILLRKGQGVLAAEEGTKTEFWSIPLQGTL